MKTYGNRQGWEDDPCSKCESGGECERMGEHIRRAVERGSAELVEVADVPDFLHENKLSLVRGQRSVYWCGGYAINAFRHGSGPVVFLATGGGRPFGPARK